MVDLLKIRQEHIDDLIKGHTEGPRRTSKEHLTSQASLVQLKVSVYNSMKRELLCKNGIYGRAARRKLHPTKNNKKALLTFAKKKKKTS